MYTLIQTIENMNPDDLAFGIAFLGIATMIIIIGAILWFFISALGFRKMFIKAGEAGWKAFIPVYRRFIYFRFAWSTKVFWPYMIALFLFNFLPNDGSVIMSVIRLAIAIVFIVLEIKLDIRIAKSFGKGTGCGVLLLFFPFIVSLVLGFGKSVYLGNPTAAEKLDAAE